MTKNNRKHRWQLVWVTDELEVYQCINCGYENVDNMILTENNGVCEFIEITGCPGSNKNV